MIDPSARIEAGRKSAKNVSIGPYCTIGPHVTIGDDCRLLAHVNLTGHTSIGPRTVIHPFASLGSVPQSFSYKGEPTKLVVGADCDIPRACDHEHWHCGRPRRHHRRRQVFFHVGAHVAHDCQIGDNFVCANNVMLAGHVSIGNNVVFGGGVAVRQFVRIGDGAMIVGLSGARADVIPWGMAQGPLADLVGLNVVGMRRGGMAKAEILTVRRAYQALFFGGGEFRARLDQVEREFGGDARVRKIVDFIRAGKRPLTMAVKRGESDEDV